MGRFLLILGNFFGTVTLRVPPFFEKFSEQIANGPRVVPWPVVYENGLVSQITAPGRAIL